MLVSLAYNLIAATSSIRKIEALPSLTSNGRQRTKVTFIDGSHEIVPTPIEKLEWATGAIVPAPAGYQIVQAYPSDERGGPWTFHLYPVLAFRITGDDPMPITHWGPLRENWGLVWPDGRVEEIGSQLFDSLDAYKAAFRREAQK